MEILGFRSSSLSLVASQKPNSGTRAVGAAKKSTIAFPVGEPYTGRRQDNSNSAPVKLLSRVQELRLLSKAEKAGLLSAAERFGLSLSSVEKLGLLSKAEELGLLSAATDQGTPSALLSLSLVLLLLGPLFVFFVPEEYAWEVVAQVMVALVSIVGGSAAFAASSLVSNLQKSD